MNDATQQIPTSNSPSTGATSEAPPNAWGKLTNISRDLDQLKIELPHYIFCVGDKFVIGRADTSHLVVSHLGISGTHCVLRRIAGKDFAFEITDLSTNGTYVNGQRIPKGKPQEVDWGARIELMRIGSARVSFLIGQAGKRSQLLNNRYLVRGHLGNGAYAKVVLALEPETHQQYALKIVERKMLGANQSTEQIFSEVKILKTLDHPGVVRCHDYFTNNSRIYIALDYVPGGDLLDRLINRKQPMSLEEAKDIFVQLTEAVDYLHRNKVVHRDIKPENILIDDREYHEQLRLNNHVPQFSQSQSQQTADPDDGINPKKFDQTAKEKYKITPLMREEYNRQASLGASRLRVKLTDFGLSKSWQEESSPNTPKSLNNDDGELDDAQKEVAKRFTTICGTPQYLAPEVLKLFRPQSGNNPRMENKGYGPEVDLWSLGAILFVMLTLHTPFDDATLTEAALAGKYQRQRVESFPEVLTLLDGLFQPDPAKRTTLEGIKNHPWCCDLFEQRRKEVEEKKKTFGLSSGQHTTELESTGAQDNNDGSLDQSTNDKKRKTPVTLQPSDANDEDGDKVNKRPRYD